MKHEQKSKYRCTFDSSCSYVTNDKTCFEKHTKQHVNQRDFACCYCAYRAVTKSHVVTHIRRVHANQKAYACDICPFSTAYPLSLRHHVMAHMGIKPFSCPYCNFNSSLRAKVLFHMKTKHPGLNSSHVPESDVKIEIDVNKYKIDNISKMENAVFRITNASETSLSGTQQIDNVVMGWELNQQNPAMSLADVQVLNFADDNFVMSHSANTLQQSDEQMSSYTEGIQYHVMQNPIRDESVDTAQNLITSEPSNVDESLTELQQNVCDVTTDSAVVKMTNPSGNSDSQLSTVTGECDTPSAVDNDAESACALLYQCSVCDFTSTCYDVLSSHVLLHRGIRLYQCPLCGHTSQEYDDVQSHCAERHADVSHVTINEISMSLETTSAQQPDDTAMS